MEPTCRCHRGRSNSPLPAQQCCPRRAGLPAQCGSSLQRNDAGVWLCEYPGLSFQRCPVRACSLVSSLLLNGATMSQESSLTQSAHSVRQVLTAYMISFEGPSIGGRGEKSKRAAEPGSAAAPSPPMRVDWPAQPYLKPADYRDPLTGAETGAAADGPNGAPATLSGRMIRAHPRISCPP